MKRLILMLLFVPLLFVTGATVATADTCACGNGGLLWYHMSPDQPPSFWTNEGCSIRFATRTNADGHTEMCLEP